MTDDEVAERPSAFMLGKEFIIVLVIVFSGLSFTLGYFVGKSGDRNAPLVLQPVESPGLFQKQELTPAPSSLPIAPAPEQPQAVMPPIGERVSQIISVTEKPARQKSAESQLREPAQEKSARKVEPATAIEGKNVTYSVQIGAFKNIADAKNLKDKFDRMGYKSFISESRSKTAQKIFKVKTGEFSEKREAEVFALKLKKTEGLQTYVTTRAE